MVSTLLDMTQEVASALSSDEVNSIGDTTESLQIAQIIKRKTLDIWARTHLPERDQLIQLIPSNDPDFPVLMTVPENVTDIQWIKYFNSSATDDTNLVLFRSAQKLYLSSAGLNGSTGFLFLRPCIMSRA